MFSSGKDLRLGSGFLEIPKAEVTKEKNTLDFMKLKTLCFKGHQ